MKKIIWMLIFLICLAGTYRILQMKVGFDPIDDIKEKDTALTTINEVADKLNEAILDDTDGTLLLYISNNVSNDELKNVNYFIDTVNGSITSMSIYYSVTDARRVEFSYSRSDSLYVKDSIINGKAIPPDKTSASVLLEKTNSILSSVVSSNMSSYDKELAIHDYLVNNCVYGHSSSNDESEYTAYGALVNGKAVCSGYAAAMDLLLSCTGIDTEFVIGTAVSENENGENVTDNHAWNQVNIDGTWYNLDATWDDPVGEKNVISHQYFNVTDDILSRNHMWDQTKTNPCTSMDKNYFSVNGIWFSDAASLQNYLSGMNINSGSIECALNNFNVGTNELQVLYGVSGIDKIGYRISGETDYQILNIILNE